MFKICARCNKEKDIILFGKDSRSKDNLYCYCKECKKNLDLQRKIKNPDYFKEYERTKRNRPIGYKQIQKNRHPRLGKSIKNPRFILDKSLRRRFRKFFHEVDKRKSSFIIELLGCQLNELKAYLESKFEPGMTWNNYGMYGWHIDHKIPLSSFNLTDLEDQKKAWHFSNLQPLWAMDNWKKSNKLR